MRRMVLHLCLWLGLLWAPLQAQALCLGPLCTCSASVGSLAFGNINPLSASPTDSTATLRLSCGGTVALLVPYTVSIGAGTGGSVADRRMSSSGGTLSYGLYRDAARSVPWGDGTASTSVLNGGVTLDALGLAPDTVMTLYGRVPGGQRTVAPGSYSDVLTVTVTYY